MKQIGYSTIRGLSIFCHFLLSIAFGGLSWMFFLILIIHHSPFYYDPHSHKTLSAAVPLALLT